MCNAYLLHYNTENICEILHSHINCINIADFGTWYCGTLHTPKALSLVQATVLFCKQKSQCSPIDMTED